MTIDKYGILLGITVAVTIIVTSLILLPLVFSLEYDRNGQSIITGSQPYHTWENEVSISLFINPNLTELSK